MDTCLPARIYSFPCISYYKSLVAGGSASLVAQSITVPIDVVSQHLMMQRKGEKMGRFQVRGNPVFLHRA